jgi:comEA protein
MTPLGDLDDFGDLDVRDVRDVRNDFGGGGRLNNFNSVNSVNGFTAFDGAENSLRSRETRDPLVRPQMKASLGRQVQAFLLSWFERFRTRSTSRPERPPKLRVGRFSRASILAIASFGCLTAMLALGFFLGVQRKGESPGAAPHRAPPGAGPANQPLATLPLVGGRSSPVVVTALDPTGSVGSAGSAGLGNALIGLPARPSVAPATIAVHAAGAVTNPAVYNLAAGARVDDVIHAAGGLRSDADTDAVNLAAHVGDGERVFVPRKGQPIPIVQTGFGQPLADSVGVSTATTGAGGVAGNLPQGKAILDLNAATAAELDSLPGVGPATAGKIIDFRTRVGRFRSVSQLLEVPGIGDAKLAGLRSRVRV